MMISLLTFGLSWIVYAFVFFGIATIMPQFHASYSETNFGVGFLVGFFSAAILRGSRLASFKIHWIGMIVLLIVINYALLAMLNDHFQDYYVTGHFAQWVAAVILGVFAVGFDVVKNIVIANFNL